MKTTKQIVDKLIERKESSDLVFDFFFDVTVEYLTLMEAWCFLLEKDHLIDWENYAPYGVPILKQICDLFGFEVSDSKRIQNMLNRQPCEEGCYGCIVR